MYGFNYICSQCAKPFDHSIYSEIRKQVKNHYKFAHKAIKSGDEILIVENGANGGKSRRILGKRSDTQVITDISSYVLLGGDISRYNK